MSADGAKSSIEAAQEAIAKVNAMLIAKGKLKPSQLSNTGVKKPGAQSSIITRDVEINDVPIGCRNMLTRGATQEEISKMSGASVATKGRYMTPEDKLRNPKDRPLYLYVQGTTQDAVNLAVGRINEIIANGMAKQGPRMSRFSARGSNQHGGPRHPAPLLGPNNPPPEVLGPGPLTLLQEKLYIGLEHAPPNFIVKDKILGPGGSFLQHIQGETGAKVTLRGKGSGFLEPSGGELMEPMHVHLQHVNAHGLQQAKELATNLIQTVQQEYAVFQQSFISVPPPSIGIQQQSMMVPPPQMVSLAQPPPLHPGQQMITTMPPPQQVMPPPQSSYLGPPPPATITVSLPAPGIVIPQLASSVTPIMHSQPQPGQLIHPSPQVQTYVQHTVGQPGQPIQQYIQTSEQQILGGHLVSQPQMVVSMPQGQQTGQVVYSTVGGQQMQQTVQQIPQPQLVTAQGVQIQQPGQMFQQPGQIIQQPPPQQQPLQQQFAYQQQQQQQQQQILQPGQQTIISGSQRYIQQPVMQTNIQQMVPTSTVQMAASQQPVPVSQQPSPQPVQPVSWGGPIPSAPGSVYSTLQQYSQSGDSIISVPQSQPTLVMSSSASNTTTSGYVYKAGPVEEPKRRFTEEKQEDKVPEGLLGYEHGPPHLTNLMVQSSQSQPQQQAVPQQQQQQQLVQIAQDPSQPQPQPQQQIVYGQQIIQPQQTDIQQPQQQQQQLLYSQVLQQQPQVSIQQQQQPQQQYTFVTQQQPQYQQQFPQQQQQQPYYQQQPQQLLQQQQAQQLQQQQLQQQPLQHQQQQYLQQQQQVPQGQEQTRVEGDAQNQVQTTATGEIKSEDKVLMPPPPPPGVSLKRQSPSLTPQSAPEPRKKRFHDSDEDDPDIPSSMASQAKELKKFSFNQYSSTPQLYSQQTSTTFSQYGGVAQNGSQSPGLEQFQQENQYQQQQQQQQQYQQDQNSSLFVVTGAGQTFAQYSVATSSSYNPVMSSSYSPAVSTSSYQQPPPPPPPLYEDQSSRSPDARAKGYSPQYLPTYTRDENSLRQPPPPPPPPARSRTYW